MAQLKKNNLLLNAEERCSITDSKTNKNIISLKEKYPLAKGCFKDTLLRKQTYKVVKSSH